VVWGGAAAVHASVDVLLPSLHHIHTGEGGLTMVLNTGRVPRCGAALTRRL
jgi:hypothetical protein